MKHLLPLILIMTGCGGRILLSDCQMFSAGGMTICSMEPVDKNEVELTVSEVEREAQVYYPEVVDLRQMLSRHGVFVTFLSGDLAKGCHKTAFNDVYQCNEGIGGQNENGDTIVASWSKCLAQTSLAHELLHSVEFYYLEPEGKADQDSIMNHTTPQFFDQTYGTDSCEFRAFQDLYPIFPSCNNSP